MADIEVIVSPASVTTVEVPSLVAAPEVIYTGVQGPPGTAGSNGNSFDQSLNTTDSPTFHALTITDGAEYVSTITDAGLAISGNDNFAGLGSESVNGRVDNEHGNAFLLNGSGVQFKIGNDNNAEVPTSHYGHGVIEYTTTSAGTKTFTLPSGSGTLALTNEILHFSNIGYVFVTVTENDVNKPPGGYYVVSNQADYYTQAAIYQNEVIPETKLYYSNNFWRLHDSVTGTEYVQNDFPAGNYLVPGISTPINYTGTDANGNPCSCSITFKSVTPAARPATTVGNGSSNAAGTSQLVARADHTHAIASNVVTLTGSQTLTNKSINSTQLTGTISDSRLSSNVPIMASGLISASNLPSYVDDVLEYQTTTNFPATGETGKIYVALETGLIYRWTGSIYVEISPSTVQVQSNWTASSGLGVILNKPSLATVATSGSASNLSTGTLPDARLSTNVVTLTGTQTLTNKSISSGQITGLGTAATKDIPSSGNASSTQVVYGSDTRLTDSRTPSSTLAHASSHASGGSDALTLAASQITGLASVATSGSASDLSTGTLPDARLSSNIATIQAKVSTAQADSTTSASFTDVTGLSGFTLAANTTYVFEFTGRMTIPGSSSFQVLLNSSAALANTSMSGWSIATGTQSVNAFGVSTSTTYYFLQKAGSATNNPSSAFYYIVTGSTAPTIKVQFSQQNTTVGTANLLVGAVASFRKLA